MIWRNTLLWRNVAEYSFLLVVVAALSLASSFFLHSDEFFFHKVAGREEFFNELLESVQSLERIELLTRDPFAEFFPEFFHLFVTGREEIFPVNGFHSCSKTLILSRNRSTESF